jgi:hypothetical protein
MPSSGSQYDPAEIGAQCRGKQRRMGAVYCNRRRDGRDIQILRSSADIAVTEVRFGCARRCRPSCLFLISATQFLPPARRTCTDAVVLPRQMAPVFRIS